MNTDQLFLSFGYKRTKVKSIFWIILEIISKHAKIVIYYQTII